MARRSRLKAAREAEGFTQESLAEELGIDRTTRAGGNKASRRRAQLSARRSPRC